MSVRSERQPTALEGELDTRSSPRLTRALDLAEGAHRGQRRTNGRPYLSHPVEVAGVLAQQDADETLLVAALLHDVVEDSDTRVEAIAAGFGADVARLVEALTEDPEIEEWVERKAALRAQVRAAGPRATTIYVADKLVNLRELRATYASAGEDAIDLHKAPTLDARTEAWWEDVAMAEGGGVTAGLLDPLRDELRAFERERDADPGEPR